MSFRSHLPYTYEAVTLVIADADTGDICILTAIIKTRVPLTCILARRLTYDTHLLQVPLRKKISRLPEY